MKAQGWAWRRAGTRLFALLAGYGALKSARGQAEARRQPKVVKSAPAGTKISIQLQVLWILLSAIASQCWLATTSQITQEVAAIPFLWVLPLSIYLLTFILAFSGGRGYSRRVYRVAYFGFTFLQHVDVGEISSFTILTQMLIYAGLLFVASMICHCELYGLRPSPRSLPSFYLMVAVGGALGGISSTWSHRSYSLPVSGSCSGPSSPAVCCLRS